MDLGSHVHIDVLWPPPDMPPDTDANDTSLALRFNCDGKTIFIAGDAALAEEQALLEEPAALKSDVLMMPHHGAFIASTEQFEQAVAPSAVVISRASDPRPPNRPAPPPSSTTACEKPPPATKPGATAASSSALAPRA